MAVQTGIAGSVTSWGSGTVHAQLAGTGTRPASFTLNLEGEEFDTTAFADAGVGAHIKGLSGASFDATAQLLVPEHGANGLVTFSAGYAVNLNSWAIEITRADFESTAFGATVKAYAPGKYDWNGEFSGFLDGTTAAAGVGNSSEPATGTFKFSEQGATDMTLSGSIFTTGATIAVSPSALNAISYRYRGTGAVTMSTASAGTPPLPTGALALTAAETVVLTASSGRTYTASAFWTRIGIRCAVGQLTEVSFRGRITGAVTIA